MRLRSIDFSFLIICIISSISVALDLPNAITSDSLVLDCTFSGKAVPTNRNVSYKVRFTIIPTNTKNTHLIPIDADTNQLFNWYLIRATFTQFNGMPMYYSATPPDTTQHIDLNTYPFLYASSLLKDIPTKMPVSSTTETHSYYQIAKNDSVKSSLFKWYDPSTINNPGGGIPGNSNYQWYGATAIYSSVLYNFNIFSRFISEDNLITLAGKTTHNIDYGEFSLTNYGYTCGHFITVGDTFFTSVYTYHGYYGGFTTNTVTAKLKLITLKQIYPPIETSANPNILQRNKKAILYQNSPNNLHCYDLMGRAININNPASVSNNLVFVKVNNTQQIKPRLLIK